MSLQPAKTLTIKKPNVIIMLDYYKYKRGEKSGRNTEENPKGK